MCIICQTRPATFDGWCDTCKGRVLAEVLSMCDLPKGELAIMADMHRLVHCNFIAHVITRVPFTPFETTLTRLTDE